MKRPFLLAGLLGSAALAVGLTIQLPLRGYDFVCQPPFTKPFLALEFIPDPPALHRFFETGRDYFESIGAMCIALHRDNYFAWAYTAFLLAFAWTCRKVTGQRWFILLLPLAMMIGIADLVENSRIGDLLDTLLVSSRQVTPEDVNRVHPAVWTKSLGMAVFLLAAAAFLWRAGWVGRVLSVLAAAAGVLGLLTPFRIEWFETYAFGGLTIFFPLLVIFCLFYRPKPV